MVQLCGQGWEMVLEIQAATRTFPCLSGCCRGETGGTGLSGGHGSHTCEQHQHSVFRSQGLKGKAALLHAPGGQAAATAMRSACFDFIGQTRFLENNKETVCTILGFPGKQNHWDICSLSLSLCLSLSLTHTHTHRNWDRERDRERQNRDEEGCVITRNWLHSCGGWEVYQAFSGLYDAHSHRGGNLLSPSI